QPLMYKAIKEHPPLWETYAKKLGVSDVGARVETIKAEFAAAQKRAGQFTKKQVLRELPKYWDEYFGGRYKPEFEVPTGLAQEELNELSERLTTPPDGFHVHPKVKKLLEQRAE